MMLLGGLIACGDSSRSNHLADAPLARIVIEPADLSVHVVDDAVVMQPYKAHIVDAKGLDVDITSETTFTLHDAGYGSFSGATLTVSGQGAGPTRVEASARGQTGDTGLTVFVKRTITDPAAPGDSVALFGTATEDARLAPTIVYPLDRILVPPNLGQFDVHWSNPSASASNLFEVTMANQYVDVRLYTTGLDPKNPQAFWAAYPPAAWYPIASSRQTLLLRVAGLDTAHPATKGTASTLRVDVTNENAQGGIYYWTTSGLAGIWRYDVGHPEIPPAPYFADAARPASCMGCHVLSRDGTKIAMTFDGGNGRATVFNVPDRKALIPFDGVSQPALHWDFATFDADATKLVTIEGSQIYLRALDGTRLAGPLPPVVAGGLATHPEISPDNKRLVSVEFNGGYDAAAYNGSIVMRSFDTATNSFGTPTVLVPYAANAASWYPSFSPDGEWIAFTRTTSYSYNDGSAQVWLVKADGSQPPIQLATADLAGSSFGNMTNSWARWVPFGQTFGPDNEKLFYLTFSTQRPFGVRIPGGRRPQIWMTPVFPSRAAAGQDPSGNAFRVPFQDVNTSNHIAQWTKSVVVQ
jgi:hypothetical protein